MSVIWNRRPLTDDTITVESTKEKVLLYDHKGTKLVRNKQAGFIKDKEKKDDYDRSDHTG